MITAAAAKCYHGLKDRRKVQRAMAIVRVQGRGQLTLPAAFRKSVGVNPGDVLLLEERGPGHFEVRVLSRRSLLEFPRVELREFDMRSLREEMEHEMAEEVGPDTPGEGTEKTRQRIAARDA